MNRCPKCFKNRVCGIDLISLFDEELGSFTRSVMESICYHDHNITPKQVEIIYNVVFERKGEKVYELLTQMSHFPGPIQEWLLIATANQEVIFLLNGEERILDYEIVLEAIHWNDDPETELIEYYMNKMDDKEVEEIMNSESPDDLVDPFCDINLGNKVLRSRSC